MQFLGISMGTVQLPTVTVETAMEVPAVSGAVNFLSATLASLPLQAFRKADGEAAKIDGELAMLLNEAPNPEWSSFAWRKYMWQQVLTGGRGLTWIERSGARPLALWPMDPTQTAVKRVKGKRVYVFAGREYPAEDVIDVTFMLRADQLTAYGPIAKGRKTIGLAIAMSDFAASLPGAECRRWRWKARCRRGRRRSSGRRRIFSGRSTWRSRRERRSSGCRRAMR
jgi:HK97 family phage portal protein